MQKQQNMQKFSCQHPKTQLFLDTLKKVFSSLCFKVGLWGTCNHELCQFSSISSFNVVIQNSCLIRKQKEETAFNCSTTMSMPQQEINQVKQFIGCKSLHPRKKAKGMKELNICSLEQCQPPPPCSWLGFEEQCMRMQLCPYLKK